MHQHKHRETHDALEQWRRLDRWLAQLPENDPSRRKFQRRIDEARDEYLESVDAARRRHVES